MSIFTNQDSEALGRVIEVDTSTVVVRVTDASKLRRLQVNRLVLLQSSRAGEHLIGMVQKIVRSISTAKATGGEIGEDTSGNAEEDIVRVTLIGTHINKQGDQSNVFRRTLETVPEIDANCFQIEGDSLTEFMKVIARVDDEHNADPQRLKLGVYTLDESANAFLNGNKFFQRHAIIVGSTGSGKSWTTATVLEQVAKLPNANAIIFDIHGEYTPLRAENIQRYRIAGPADLDKQLDLHKNGVIFLPYWMLEYEAMVSMFVDRTDQNAPNQTMLMSRAVVAAKKKYLLNQGETDVLNNFTIDSPVPFDIDDVVAKLQKYNIEMVEGTRGPKQGPYFDKLSRLIARLENKLTDRRLGFLFKGGDETMNYDYLGKLSLALIGGSQDQSEGKGGVKIVDFSEVPSDILPLIVSLVGRLAFSIQQWSSIDKRHPIALFCDEAHLYIPERSRGNSGNEISISTFERIAKEGRKYGVGLVVISQRPSEVNRTVLSQCNNLISMRLTNAEDQGVVRRLLPDSLGGFSDVLPILDIGEALVVGDASLLPCRIRVDKPQTKPSSGTVNFWSEWSRPEKIHAILPAVKGWRKQAH